MRRRKLSQGYQVQFVQTGVVGHFEGGDGICVRPIESECEPRGEKPNARFVGGARERSLDDRAGMVRDRRWASIWCWAWREQGRIGVADSAHRSPRTPPKAAAQAARARAVAAIAAASEFIGSR